MAVTSQFLEVKSVQKMGCTSQICLNGHVIMQVAESAPEFRQEFCERCGESTISACRNCNTAIRGLHHAGAGRHTVGGPNSPPGFCRGCGEPYPWTATALQAAQELADELDDLTDGQREILMIMHEMQRVNGELWQLRCGLVCVHLPSAE